MNGEINGRKYRGRPREIMLKSELTQNTRKQDLLRAMDAYIIWQGAR